MSDDPKPKTKFYHWLWAGILLFLVVSSYQLANMVAFKPYDGPSIMGLLSSLFMVALFMERALEVFVAAWRAPGLDKLNLEINHKRHLRKDLDQQIDCAPNNEKAALHEQRKEVHANLANSHQDRATHRADTRLWVMKASLIFGVLISLAGVRTLEPLVVDLKPLLPLQVGVFRACDVFLTGGLIAGGSGGIHQVVSAFTSFMDATKEKNQTSTL